MPTFGPKSRRCRDQCHARLKLVLDEAILRYDFSVIWGFRDREDQQAAYENGTSQLRFPFSKHNRKPSRAFDVIPYPDGFEASDEEFYKQATHILRAANHHQVRLNWGGHWRGLRDLAHFELDDKEV